MKYQAALLGFLLLILTQGYAQSPVYYFNINTYIDTESNAHVIAGYVKTNTAPLSADSIAIVLRSGSPRPTHMDTTSMYMIHFSAGEDSVAFTLQILKDTFPEYPEHVLYVLSGPAGGASIGADSTLLFLLIDTTPPATIQYIIDSASCYEDPDSFYNGVYVVYPLGNTFNVGIRITNPNPFYVRYIANSIDCSSNFGYPFINACQYSDYYYNPQVCYAPPGISTYYKTAYIKNLYTPYNKYFLCRLQNIDANIITDSLVFFTIKPSTFFDTASLSFDKNSIIVVNDSFQSIGIPITISNPNEKPMYFRIDTTQSNSVYLGINYTFNNQEYGYGHGISHDTFWVNFINSHLTGDTISMVFALRNDSVNASADTLLSITVIDTGSLYISFLGAGLAHLKSDSIGYVNMYNSSFAKYPISVKVSYLNGNAIRDTDFIFDDTTITFPPFTFDTISVPVIMLQDHRYQGNTQVNLQLSNVNPADVQYGITQYTFTIIDDEDSGLTPLGVQPLESGAGIKVFPNPFANEISISSPLSKYGISITNSIGQEVYHNDNQKGDLDLDLGGQASGLYLLMVSDGDKTYIKKILKL